MYSQESCCLFLKSGWSIPHLEADEKWLGEISGRFCRKNMKQMSCLHMSSDCIFGIPVDFMPFLKRLYACGSSRVSFAIDCLGTCLILLSQTWLKEWRNCTLELIKFPFQSQMIQLAEPSTTWNHMYMNLRNHWMPQVLEKTLRRQVQRIPQLRCRYFQDVS